MIARAFVYCGGEVEWEMEGPPPRTPSWFAAVGDAIAEQADRDGRFPGVTLGVACVYGGGDSAAVGAFGYEGSPFYVPLDGDGQSTVGDWHERADGE